MGTSEERYPELYEEAKSYERPYEGSGNTFTWSERESLAEIERPERMEAIKRDHEERRARKQKLRENLTLAQVFEGEVEEEERGCLICSL